MEMVVLAIISIACGVMIVTAVRAVVSDWASRRREPVVPVEQGAVNWGQDPLVSESEFKALWEEMEQERRLYRQRRLPEIRCERCHQPRFAIPERNFEEYLVRRLEALYKSREKRPPVGLWRQEDGGASTEAQTAERLASAEERDSAAAV